MKAVAPRGWGTPPPRRSQGWVRITSPSKPKMGQFPAGVDMVIGARFQGSWSGPLRAVSIGSMRYKWDVERAAANQRDHGVSFEAVRGFRWETALEAEDQGGGPGVRRVIALGRVVARLHVMVYTRRGETVRVISLRRATPQEEERYEHG